MRFSFSSATSTAVTGRYLRAKTGTYYVRNLGLDNLSYATGGAKPDGEDRDHSYADVRPEDHEWNVVVKGAVDLVWAPWTFQTDLGSSKWSHRKRFALNSTGTVVFSAWVFTELYYAAKALDQADSDHEKLALTVTDLSLKSAGMLSYAWGTWKPSVSFQRGMAKAKYRRWPAGTPYKTMLAYQANTKAGLKVTKAATAARWARVGNVAFVAGDIAAIVAIGYNSDLDDAEKAILITSRVINIVSALAMGAGPGFAVALAASYIADGLIAMRNGLTLGGSSEERDYFDFTHDDYWHHHGDDVSGAILGTLRLGPSLGYALLNGLKNSFWGQTSEQPWRMMHFTTDEWHGGDGDDKMAGGRGLHYQHGELSSPNETLFGYGGHDLLLGDHTHDGLGADGDDNLADGDDVLHGGSGNDTLLGGGGSDVLYGDGDDDILVGGGHMSYWDHSEHRDNPEFNRVVHHEFRGAIVRVYGDFLDGGNGNDTAHYGRSNEGVIVNLVTGRGVGGDAHGDYLVRIENLLGSDHDDELILDKGDNYAFGGKGSDWLKGNGGDDWLVPIAGDGDEGDREWLDGDDGNDTVDYSSANQKINIDLSTTIVSAVAIGNNNVRMTDSRGWQWTVHFADWSYFDATDYPGTSVGHFGAHEDYLFKVENIIGTDHNDVLTGGDERNVFSGGGGDDLLRGEGGDDVLYGGDGSDSLDGGDGDDLLFAVGDGGEGHGANVIDGGDDTDTVSYANASHKVIMSLDGSITNSWAAQKDSYIDIENVTGSEHNDQITGDGDDNVLRGGDGDDLLRGQDGDDVLFGGDGSDSLDGGDGDDIIFAVKNEGAGHGANVIDGGDDTDTVSYANAGHKVIMSLDGSITNSWAAQKDSYIDIENVTGSEHNDQITGDGGANELRGGDGHDLLRGQGGDDTLLGGDGDDELHGGSENDTLVGGAGDDTLYGGDGDDTLIGSQDFSLLTAQFKGIDGQYLELDTGRNEDFNRSDNLYAELSFMLSAGTGAKTLLHIGDKINSGKTYLKVSLSGNDLRVRIPGVANEVVIADANLNDGLIHKLGISWKADSRTLTVLDGSKVLHQADYASGTGLASVGVNNAAVRIGASLDWDTSGQKTFDGVLLGASVYNDYLANISRPVLELVYDPSRREYVNLPFLGGSDSGRLTSTLAAVPGAGTHLSSKGTINGGAGDDTIAAGSGDNVVDAGSGSNFVTTNGSGSYSAAPAGQDVNTLSFLKNFTYREGVWIGAIKPGTNEALPNAKRRYLHNFGAYEQSENRSAEEIRVLMSNDWGMFSKNNISGFQKIVGTKYGDDYIAGLDGEDYLHGAGGDDSLLGHGGHDALFGEDGDDSLDGGRGDDILDGGAGDDSLVGGAGDDLLNGGDGADVIIGGANGAGGDMVDYSAAGGSVTVALADGDAVANVSGAAAGDRVSLVENTRGSRFADTLTGNDAPNLLAGFAGDDVLDGGGGNDILEGESGEDTLRGGDGDDVLRGGGGDYESIGLALSGAANARLALLSSDWRGATGINLHLEFGTTATGNMTLAQAVTHGSDTVQFSVQLVGSNLVIAVPGASHTLSLASGVSLRDGKRHKLQLFWEQSSGELTGALDGATLMAAPVVLGAGAALAGNVDIFIGNNHGGQAGFNGTLYDARLLLDLPSGKLRGLVDLPLIDGGGIPRNHGVGGAFVGTGYSWIGERDSLDGGNDNDTLIGGLGADHLKGGAGDDTIFGGWESLEAGLKGSLYGLDRALTSLDEARAVATAAEERAVFSARDISYSSSTADVDFNGFLEGDAASLDLAAARTKPVGNSLMKLEGFVYLAAGTHRFETRSDGGLSLSIGGYLDLIETSGPGVQTGSGSFLASEAGYYKIEILKYSNGDADKELTVTLNGSSLNSSAHKLTTSIDDESNDTLLGDAGNDTLAGGAGDDYLDGGAGDDFLDGGADDDVLNGGSGDDVLMGVEDGGAGYDANAYHGGDGVDAVSYENAGYRIEASLDGSIKNSWAAQRDTFVEVEKLFGTGFDDLMAGDGGDNELRGGDGDDTLKGQGGDDTLLGGAGDDVLQGGSGDDVLMGVEDGGAGYDANAYHGGDGVDAVSYENASYRIEASLDGSINNSWAAQRDSFVKVEKLFGTGFDDLMAGDGGDNELRGGDGDDTLKGQGGDDTLLGGDGNDELHGGAGNDTYVFDFGQSSGQDRIANETEAASDRASTTDRAVFQDVAHEQLWFFKNGDDLRIRKFGSSDMVTVEDWYSQSERSLDEVATGTSIASTPGYTTQNTITAANIDTLVQAMASFTESSVVDGSVAQDQGYNAVNATLVAAWA